MPNTTQFNHNLVDNDSDLLYKNRGVLTSLGLGVEIYVSATGGVDNLAMIGRIDRPFKTIQAAVSACVEGTQQYHVKILNGGYNEAVVCPTTFQRGMIEYFPGSYHFYSGNDDKYTLTLNSSTIHVKGSDPLKCAIIRSGTSTGGAIKWDYVYYDNLQVLKGLNIQSSGTGVAVDKVVYMEDCYVKSTGGHAVNTVSVPFFKNCVIISTVGRGVYVNARPIFNKCYVYANGYGVLHNNQAGLTANESTFISVTTDAYYGNNYNAGSRIDNCYFKGFTLAARFDTYNYGDVNPHIIRNTVFQVTDPAATHSVRTWFLIGQNIICAGNKAMQNNLPYVEQDIVLTDALVTVESHGHSQYEIFLLNYYGN